MWRVKFKFNLTSGFKHFLIRSNYPPQSPYYPILPKMRRLNYEGRLIAYKYLIHKSIDTCLLK